MAKTHDNGKFIYTLKRQGSLHISIVQTFPTESEISAYQDPSVGWPEKLGFHIPSKFSVTKGWPTYKVTLCIYVRE